MTGGGGGKDEGEGRQDGRTEGGRQDGGRAEGQRKGGRRVGGNDFDLLCGGHVEMEIIYGLRGGGQGGVQGAAVVSEGF